MISTNKIKHIKSLHQKKFRQTNKQFIVEGFKVVCDVVNSNYSIDSIYVTSDFEEKLDCELIVI